MEIVHHKGALDIGILLLAMPHFLPQFDDHKLGRVRLEKTQNFKAGHRPIETSGSLLSHRAASREGDDFVIWSLLMSESTIFYNAETVWESMQGLGYETSAKTGNIVTSVGQVRIGFLVSSAPRLKKRGLGWAPASLASPSSIFSEQECPNGFDGGSGESGLITMDGLVADWLLCKINGPSFYTRAIF